MRVEARRTLFYTLVVTSILAALWLKFLTGGALRGNLYDVLLVFVLASATFSTRNLWLLKSAADEAVPGGLRRPQAALNRTSVAAWAAIAVGAELVQGLLRVATGEDVLGRFDPVDLACYLTGAILSYAVNRLLYRDGTDPRGGAAPYRHDRTELATGFANLPDVTNAVGRSSARSRAPSLGAPVTMALVPSAPRAAACRGVC